MVLAWMIFNEIQGVTRGTLIRDLFQNTSGGWRRIQHDKLLPNGTVLDPIRVPQPK